MMELDAIKRLADALNPAQREAAREELSRILVSAFDCRSNNNKKAKARKRLAKRGYKGFQ